MATASNNNKPPLAALVQAGEQQTEAIPISDGIFMAKDISNAYLVTTAAGDVLVNAGFMASAERNKSVFSAVRTGPLKNIILTQGHADHYGGVPDLKEESTQIIAERRFTETCAFFTRLMPYLGRRSARLWSGTIKRGNNPVPTIVPDIEVDECYDFELGDFIGCFSIDKSLLEDLSANS
ncbi:MAG: MBL fold metallo-hydrolase [Spongiibacteraceae bacterium]|nr:MBL fold metallo-hydrolase [Spongiibacteraceae bacterium]